jgi:hypothetical protein
MTTTTRSSLSHDIGADGLLAVRLRDGEVRLRAVDGSTVRVRDANDHDLDEMFSIETSDGSIALRSARGSDGVWRPGGHRPSPDVDIEVPRRATIVVEAASGQIEADGLHGDQRYRTVSGEVTLRAVSGRIAVEAVSGDVDIAATGASELTVRSVSGDLAIRAATLSGLRAGTMSGDLKIAGRLGGPGPFQIDTVSGDVLLAPAGDLRIETTTLTGDLRSEVDGRSAGGRGRRTLEVGSGGPLLTHRSLSGDLRVVRPTPIGAPVGTEPAPADVPPAAGTIGSDLLPAMPTPPSPPSPPSPAIAAAYDDARLRILRSLERGEIDVAEAGRRLEALDGGRPDDATTRVSHG